MKRMRISTSLLLLVAALYFYVVSTANADTLEVEPGTYIQRGHDIDKLIRHLELDNVVLVGWSYGCLACYA